MRGSGFQSEDPKDCGPAAVRAQLHTILSSPDFIVPARLRAFLTFVVEECLAGRGDRIKAFSIATHVFGRDDDFDVLNDPVVRIEAGRLRRALERYYLLSGRHDPIIIDIPKGSYAPRIERREDGPIAASAPELKAPPDLQPPPKMQKAQICKRGLGAAVLAIGIVLISAVVIARMMDNGTQEVSDPEVTLAVAPLSNLSGPEGVSLAAGISDELLSQLARFKEIRVFARTPIAAGREPDKKTFEASYLLEGSIRVAGVRLRVAARLLESRTAKVAWSQVYERDLRETGAFEVESDIAAKVAAAVAQPYGVIFTPLSSAAAIRLPDNADAYLCVLRFYQYRKVLNREEHATTRECLEKTISSSPGYSTGWAMLAYLYLDEDRFDLNRRPNGASGVVRAREASERAVMLDPANVRALQALMTVLFFSRQPEEALKIGEQALALNPNDTELLAEFGSRIAQTGDWQRGARMMEDALARNPAQAGYYTGLVAQAYYMMGDDKRAVEWIRRADLQKFSIYHFVAALIFARAGLSQEARASVSQFLKMRPRFFDDFRGELTMRNFNATDRAVLIEGARSAGFPVNPVSN